MAAPDITSSAKVASADPKAAAVPRKRRRRTAATGATDDCFACLKRQVKCDRKRPYCGQCLDIGKECSGYKTTLTWGVGVASRGKLRGLSCPVAKQAQQTGVSKTAERSAQRRKSSVSQNSRKKTPPKLDISKTATGSFDASSAHGNEHPIKTEASYEAQSGSSMSIPITAWQVPNFASHGNSYGEIGRLANHGLQHMQTSMAQPPTPSTSTFPQSASSASAYSDGGYMTPHSEFPQTPGSYPFGEAFPPFISNPYSDQQLNAQSTDSIQFQGNSIPSYNENIATESGYVEQLDNSVQASTDSFSQAEDFAPVTFETEESSFRTLMEGGLDYSQFDVDMEDMEEPDLERNEGQSSMGLSMPRSVFTNQFFHLSLRMQSLLDYYSKNICPVLVAFDGPANPYRMHILHLATHNEGLQNAIAALATNNMRMRNQSTLAQSGFVEDLSEAEAFITHPMVMEPTPEESCYKSLSIDQLNMQLADSRSAQDDSVLATLLILCLFHVCDSGFSKFKTQLAGVQKLLSMRKPGIQNGFTGWVEMFFTWFDVMTSAVNDRETQIQGENLDMLDYATNLGALEEFSGCDGRLFKLIARLGRLNLLSQNRPVRGGGEASQRPARPTPSSKSSSYSRWRTLRKNKRKFNPLDFDRLDGNGWGTPITTSSDEDAAGSADEEVPRQDDRHEFWSEWRDIRSRLQAWEIDVSHIPAPPSSAHAARGQPLGPEQRDLVHISESFRYSALLYTERLAHPLLPSSSPIFQDLVTKALSHIEELPVTSCVNKFLLWPLFMAGTECVDEGHRQTVRMRCVEIQKESGFFNNLSGLEVLEKVWRETGSGMKGGEDEEVRRRRRDSMSRETGRWGQAFRWRRAMDRVDGEYIVI